MRSPVPSLALEVDFLQRSVRVDGMPVDLTAIEFGILAALAREPGAVVTRRRAARPRLRARLRR